MGFVLPAAVSLHSDFWPFETAEVKMRSPGLTASFGAGCSASAMRCPSEALHAVRIRVILVFSVPCLPRAPAASSRQVQGTRGGDCDYERSAVGD